MQICEFTVVIQQDTEKCKKHKSTNFGLEKCGEVVRYNLINMGVCEKNIAETAESLHTENSPVLFLSEEAVCFSENEFIEVIEKTKEYGKVGIYDENCKKIYGFCVQKYEKNIENIVLPRAANVNNNGKVEHIHIVTANVLFVNNTDFRVKNELYNKKIIEKHEENGVLFLSSDGVLISPFVEIGEGTVIYPGTILKGRTKIGTNCEIGANSRIENSVVGSDTIINSTQIYDSYIGNNVKIGPFCHIRPNSKICDGVKIGDFVEVKNSVVGENTHASHLAYIGDSDVGKNVNFGCGTVTANYDGEKKARCTIEDNAFIGCNTNLIAPVKVGKFGYTAAGSTITKDVPEDSLVISRAREIKVIENWSERRNKT